MTGCLLDTNIALLALAAPERIPSRLRRTIEAGPVFLSVISYWEVLLKSMKGKLDVGDPRAWWAETLVQLAATPLLLRPEHIAAIGSLPLVHQDPFDRALIAQAIVESLRLATTDAEIRKYAFGRFSVVT